MRKTRNLVIAVVVFLIMSFANFVMAPVQADVTVLDDMTNIAARPWTDDREPAEGGIGLLQQGTDPEDGSNGVMMFDYGNTTDFLGTPDPCSGYDYLGNPVGTWDGNGVCIDSGPGGAFDADGGYRGRYDRVATAPFTPPELIGLSTSDTFTVDVYKPLTGYSGHARELQLYDSMGNRNTYKIIGEGGADRDSPGGPGRSIRNTPAGWTTYCIPLNAPYENNANLADIVTVKIWVSSWACYSTSPANPYDPVTQAAQYALWPNWGQGDWSLTPCSGLPLLIDNLKLWHCTVVLDDMDDITVRPWTDDRDPAEGTGWLSQGTDPCDGGNGVMKIDYGVTNDPCGVPDPNSGYDYLGNNVGVGAAGGAFDVNGNYLGKYDRVPSAPFTALELSGLSTEAVFTVDVYKPLTGYGEHARDLQLYDSNGLRNTYKIIGTGVTDMDNPAGGPGRSIMNTPAGWTTYCIPLDSPSEEGLASLDDVNTVKIWVSSWAGYPTSTVNPYDPNDPNYANWPDWGQGDWSLTPHSGLPLLIDNLKLWQPCWLGQPCRTPCWKPRCITYIDGDIDFDGDVDLFDFAILAGDYLEEGFGD